jgi:inorganic pyrophosphatase
MAENSCCVLAAADALDVLVLMQEPVYPMSFLRARPIGQLRERGARAAACSCRIPTYCRFAVAVAVAAGIMSMIDQGERDDKIIAVAVDDPEYFQVRS